MADGISTYISGNKAIVDNLAAFDKSMQARIQAKLEEAGQMALDEANSLVPVLTGYLQSRNQLYIDQGNVTVGNDADYALFVELGTHKMSAQPFLTPSFIDAGKWLEGEFSNLLK